MDDTEWIDDDEIHEAIDASEAEDSPEYRAKKADAIIRYVAGYRGQLWGLIRKRVIAERAYRWHPSKRTRTILASSVADEVACEIAMRHIDDVAEEIREGGFNYDHREQREFGEAFRQRMLRVLARIDASRPHQMGFVW